MLLRSLNEIELMSRKAAHGGGLSWGIADEVGKAIRWLHVFGLDGVTALLAVLEQYNHQTARQYAPQSLSGIWRAPKGILSPLLTGVSLCDCMALSQHQSVETEKIAYPLLTAGFLGYYLLGRGLPGPTDLPKEQSIQIKWSKVTLDFHRNKLAVSGSKKDLETTVSDQLVCKRELFSNRIELTQPVIGGVAVDEVRWERLQAYALNTCVEATEASRLAGAGAGLNDND